MVAGMVLVTVSPAFPLETSGSMSLFGRGERATLGVAEFPKWTRMLVRHRLEAPIEQAACTVGPCALQRWRAQIASFASHRRGDQLREINAYINRTPFVSDAINYGVVDHWATPREFFARGGDCEDFAIAKYMSLRRLGWDMDLIRIAVVMDERRRELHGVLAVKTGGTVLILDNLLPEPTDHRQIPHYRPIYSINEFAWWSHHRIGVPRVISQADKELMQRGSCRTTAEYLDALQHRGRYADMGP